MKTIYKFPAIAALMVLAACGSTSAIKPDATHQAVTGAPAGQPVLAVDLSGYDHIVVLDFTDATDKSKVSAKEAANYPQRMAEAVHSFADNIAQKVSSTGAFADVKRGPAAGRALVLSGRITRLVDGNPNLRLWIGMGAGSSYFEATTDLTDAESGEILGHITTDKNSWALGGLIAASQTVENFMNGAAQDIAKKLSDAKASAGKSHAASTARAPALALAESGQHAAAPVAVAEPRPASP